ncbi:polyamine aminopropyltransferase [Halorhodospira halophila]|uniref:Polyamine aminopropyltransferase n=1 Tax=Halorhodospira halophila (strain DSM 244 / SL1) TaxID=349124 RepID=SPEE_HALHL|nr:polyamine aminopropyltransferase [Halorhodospira halophila]A1WZR2.1 RecName: Full=Polyamine aminopropyltransferase; AltName: Full=Putrescine aminopropyltransferase; Short=PAPT; AltName: Full=Spermidine synthase; Short=SPDS; Short=SPDSY [Halorhodospira halophila SL1]ABM63174.1 spermidine synthase [Halorhodospira halophila SL1]MBK1729353.1 polyamine aminopropyltransferase [Halorhodospira halophila]
MREGWFTEAVEDEGVAFSLAIDERVHEEQSEYQHIEVYRTRRWGRLLVLDGCVMLTERDEFLYHEMMAHPALFAHREPRRVAIVGGGDCGILREVLRHPGVEHTLQVELDERVTRVAETHFPDLCTANDDERAELRFTDGLRWIREAEPESLDVVIVDSTDPVGPAAGLFTKEFLTDVRSALGPGGIVVQQSESPLLHRDSVIAPLHRAASEAGFDGVHTLTFPVPSYPSGWWSATLMVNGGDPRNFREADSEEKPFETRYYNADIHRAALAVPELLK